MSQANQTLILYKRHNPNCDVHKTRLPAAARRFWMECGCPIWIVGRTTKGVYPRQSTGLTDLKAAEALRKSLLLEATGESPHGPTIVECVEKYLISRKHEVSEKTYGHHRLLLDRLSAFCDRRRVVHIRKLTVDLLETFKTEGMPDLADTSMATMVAKLRCFLKEAYRREWITEPIVERVKTHKAVYEQKEPYTDEQVAAILAEAPKMKGGTTGYAGKPKTFTVLLELMLETGMRVSDAIRFDPKVCIKGDHLWIYTFFPQKRKKTQKPKPIEAYLTNRMKTAVDNCDWMSPRLPFAYGSSSNKAYLGNQVYELMSGIGRRCGVEDCRPHRLRDTFAVRKLLGGMAIEDLSRLLGHSSVKITEQYYAKWIRARKTRLERIVAETLTNSHTDSLVDQPAGSDPLPNHSVATS